MNNSYGVKNKTTGLFFGGFNADNSVKWVEQQAAEVMEKPIASLQAQLLAMAGFLVQKKPVAV